MGTTYVAWDGNEYEWPPPKGWYQAVDNRWWAPGTGPEALPGSPTTEDQTSVMNQETEVVNPAAVPSTTSAESALPAWAKPSDLTGEQTTYIPDVNEFEPPESNTKKILAGTVAATALLLIAAIYFLVIRGDDNEGNTAASEQGQTTTTVEKETVEETTQATQTTMSTTTELELTTTTEQAEPETTTTTFSIDTSSEKLTAFDNELQELSLEFKSGGDSSKDAELRSLATTSCQTLNAAEDDEDYSRLKNDLVSMQIKTDISKEDMGKAIDTAVDIFCPEITQ